MRQRLVNLLGEVQGKDEICLLKSQTIREIIEELQAMVQPKDPQNPSVVIKARTPFAGFDLSAQEITFTIGTVNTGTPSVSVTGTYPDYVLNFTFPPSGDNLDDYPGCPTTDDGVQYALEHTGGILQWTPIVP